jgi:hypothetical protein
MWVLVWLQLTSGMPLDYFQLGTYDSRNLCEQHRKKAEVMIVHNGMSVQCIEIDMDNAKVKRKL